MHASLFAYATREGVTRRATQVDKAGEAAAPYPENCFDRVTTQLRGDERQTYLATPVGRGTRRYSRDTRDRA
jgi:hypothetical protein